VTKLKPIVELSSALPTWQTGTDKIIQLIDLVLDVDDLALIGKLCIAVVSRSNYSIDTQESGEQATVQANFSLQAITSQVLVSPSYPLLVLFIRLD
jgi:hypothetical protein